MKSIKRKLASLVGLATLSLAAPALAGGPLAVCEPGVPFLWPNGGTNITFNPDQGDLGPVPGASAVALVGSAFQAWEDIPSSTLSYAAGGLLPVDVDGTNFGPYLNAAAPDGLSAVVFDDDGADLHSARLRWLRRTRLRRTRVVGPRHLHDPRGPIVPQRPGVWRMQLRHSTLWCMSSATGPTSLIRWSTDRSILAPSVATVQVLLRLTRSARRRIHVGTDEIVETMYPFYYGPRIGTGSLEADDIAIASRMYPEPDYATSTGEISGQILLGSQRVTGVNVIARNVADPFNDAVSAISADFTDNTSQSRSQRWPLQDYRPDAGRRVTASTSIRYWQGILDSAGESRYRVPEELYNGANESSDPNTDDPSVFERRSRLRQERPNTGIDIIFNQPGEGDPLGVGDDGSVRLGLPFTYSICGQDFNDVYVNANGHLTFGAGNSDFSESAQEMLDGPPRIAGLWDDL